MYQLDTFYRGSPVLEPRYNEPINDGHGRYNEQLSFNTVIVKYIVKNLDITEPPNSEQI